MYRRVLQSPIGLLTLEGTEKAVTALRFGEQSAGGSTCPLLEQASAELEAYFSGVRRCFTVPLAPIGTPFQRRVWDALLTIPYGAAVSYGEIAAKLGSPKAARAVGAANHCNPLPIFIPCHRVLGRNGSLTGYAGGLQAKRSLLDLEGIRYLL